MCNVLCYLGKTSWFYFLLSPQAIPQDSSVLLTTDDLTHGYVSKITLNEQTDRFHYLKIKIHPRKQKRTKQ